MTVTLQAPSEAGVPSAARRTVLTLVACGIGILPLKALLFDNRWIGESWCAMAVVILPAAVLRLRRAPSALDIWPGIILLVPWLTRVYVSQHAWGGFIPTRATFADIGDLMDNLHHTTTTQIAPIDSTIAIRLVLCALLGLLAALIDLIAVVGRRGALAGVPLLIVYTVAGAVPRHPVNWLWFCFAAIAFLMLLALDASDELRGWGRRVARTGASRTTSGLGVSGQRIGSIAILIALFMPLLAPEHPKNLIANAFHSGGGHGLGSFGAGATVGNINPYVAMKGQLDRDVPIPLMDVSILAGDKVQPFYLRTNVLDHYTGEGWSVSDHGATESISSSGFPTSPLTNQPRTVTFRADIKITGLTGNAPTFNVPRAIVGLAGTTTWTPQDQLLLGTTVQRGDEFAETVEQPAPTVAELEAAPPVDPSSPAMSRWLQLPDMPTFVTNLVASITSRQTTPYGKARALSDWFADPKQGFIYSLKTKPGDSGNDLVDFLKNRAGFCQQYAGAMAAMLRVAGVPSRIVLGYMHTPPNAAGNFSVDTFDAHSWVEAYFDGAGWIPFDTTPASGLTGGRKSDLAWAPHVYSSGGGNNEITQKPTQIRSGGSGPSSGAAGAGSGHRSAGSAVNMSGLWVLLITFGVIGLALYPAGLRWIRRRRRFAAARRGDADALWAELSDTAIDLGYVWSAARTPRQVTEWLASDAAEATPALRELAVAVEERRYAPTPRPRDAAALAKSLDEVTDRLRSIRSARVRLQATFWPASLGWGRRLRSIVRRGRHR